MTATAINTAGPIMNEAGSRGPMPKSNDCADFDTSSGGGEPHRDSSHRYDETFTQNQP